LPRGRRQIAEPR